MRRRPNEIRVQGDSAVIYLTQGQSTIIDVADVPLVQSIRWWAMWVPDVSGFYAAGKPREADGSYCLMQMQKFLMSPPAGMQVDHRNRDTLDNRRSNLRICTRADNKRNSSRYSSNTSGYVGVYFKKRNGGSWQSSIAVDGRNIHIGTFDSAKEAAIARDREAKRVYGEFARLNFPDV